MQRSGSPVAHNPEGLTLFRELPRGEPGVPLRGEPVAVVLAGQGRVGCRTCGLSGSRKRISVSCERLRALLPRFDGRREDMASVLEMAVQFLRLAGTLLPSQEPHPVSGVRARAALRGGAVGGQGGCDGGGAVFSVCAGSSCPCTVSPSEAGAPRNRLGPRFSP